VSVTLSATAATGRTFAGWSGAGCSGTGTCVVTMDAAKDVTATFSVAATDGVCGSAAGQSFIVKPTANLCSTGTSGTVNSANGQYSWTCNGTGGGNSPSCTANWANNAGAGTGSIVNNGSNDWVVTSASFSTTSPATPPAGTSFPNGILSLNLTTTGAAGSDATVVVYYNTPVPAGAVYWKYGRTQSDPTDHWYQLPADRAKFASDRLSVTLRLTDGGIGDHDLVAGSITDPGGPGMPSGGSVTSVPTLSEWGMIVMSLLLAGMTALRLRRE
jgi:hypothetical protein